jgi:hypothetical protein
MKRAVIFALALTVAISLIWTAVILAAPRAVPYEAGEIQISKMQRTKPALTGNIEIPKAQTLSFPNSLKNGSQRLADLQSATDGGWDWDVDSSQATHSGSASPTNTYGVTALGVLGAYLRNKEAFQQTVIQDAFNLGIEPNVLVRTGGVPQFLIKAKQVFGTMAYADTGKSRYDVRKSLAPPSGTAGDRARQIRDVRCGGGLCNGIIPWDIGLVAADAYAVSEEFGASYGDDVDSMALVIYDVLYTTGAFYFDMADRNEWWWTLGVSGALEAFTLSGNYPTERDQLLDTLLKYQLPDGSWEWGALYPGAGDWQTTAYAVRALAIYESIVGGSNAREAAFKGARWLALQQSRYNWGWFYTGYSLAENTEVDGECLWALYLAGPFVPPVPAFTSYGYVAIPVLVILIGAGALLYRRRKTIHSF